MKIYSLNEIIRSSLLTTGKPIHYYMQFLHYGIKAIKEINYDSPFAIKSVKLTVDANLEVTLPDDYVDHIRVGWENGQYVKELIQKDSFNRLMNLDDSGNQIPYPDIESSMGSYSDNYSSNHNDKNEHLGKNFGHVPVYNNAFMVIQERNKIMLDPSLENAKCIILDYITTALPEGSQGTTLPAYAAETIERYILWRYTEHDRMAPMNLKQLAKEEFIHAHKRYRSRNYQVTMNDILKSLRSSTFAAIKS
tara:strand:+ start:1886 stop:2635 length:750 start_codon:yes stop_codon:yes gene_type:complete